MYVAALHRLTLSRMTDLYIHGPVCASMFVACRAVEFISPPPPPLTHRCPLVPLPFLAAPPQVLLACISRPSKTVLSRLGIFSVTSFHALVRARNPLPLPRGLGAQDLCKAGRLSPHAERAALAKPRSRTPTGTMNSSLSSE